MSYNKRTNLSFNSLGLEVPTAPTLLNSTKNAYAAKTKYAILNFSLKKHVTFLSVSNCSILLKIRGLKNCCSAPSDNVL